MPPKRTRTTMTTKMHRKTAIIGDLPLPLEPDPLVPAPQRPPAAAQRRAGGAAAGGLERGAECVERSERVRCHSALSWRHAHLAPTPLRRHLRKELGLGRPRPECDSVFTPAEVAARVGSFGSSVVRSKRFQLGRAGEL
mmetsp:Transcript_66368/g.190821  ORF Transcript_66368/g.190821 Transcript_66368/m.190821 type:complete len:139 (+) Transcript_66368:467-883(+)